MSRTRLKAAAVFAVTGTLLAATWFFPAFRRGDALVSAGLYIGLPGIAAAVTGWLGGPFLTDGVASGATASWRGALTSLVALVIFAPLFALGIKLSEPGPTNVGWLTVATLWVSLLAVGWVVVGVGAFAGWVVWRLGR